jgi:hypothetical protein
MTQVAPNPKAQATRLEWQGLLRQLADDIEKWSKTRNWAVARHVSALEESELGAYEVPAVHIHTGRGALIVEPIARHIIGGDGRVDLYNLGSFRRLILIRKGGAWVLFTEDRVPWPNPWNEATFIQVAEALTTP